jgi:hypothetical protein
MSNKKSMSAPSKQRGMTLMTTLVILLIMTTVGLTSSKLSVYDTMIARNNKVQTLVYQETANDLRELTSLEMLHDPMLSKKFNNLTGIYTVPISDSKKETVEIINAVGFDALNELYDCEGVQGRASSIGMGARKCDLFDFQVTRQKKGQSGAKDKHHAGMGKEVPPPSKYSNL